MIGPRQKMKWTSHNYSVHSELCTMNRRIMRRRKLTEHIFVSSFYLQSLWGPSACKWYRWNFFPLFFIRYSDNNFIFRYFRCVYLEKGIPRKQHSWLLPMLGYSIRFSFDIFIFLCLYLIRFCVSHCFLSISIYFCRIRWNSNMFVFHYRWIKLVRIRTRPHKSLYSNETWPSLANIHRESFILRISMWRFGKDAIFFPQSNALEVSLNNFRAA